MAKRSLPTRWLVVLGVLAMVALPVACSAGTDDDEDARADQQQADAGAFADVKIDIVLPDVRPVIEWPDGTIPGIELPDVVIPDVVIPEVNVPDVVFPDVRISTFPTPLALTQPGNAGAFDASLERDPSTGRLWMSYSSVSQLLLQGVFVHAVATRIAHSDDDGVTWHDDGEVNAPTLQALPSPVNQGVWNHEVSRLVYRPNAPVSERWVLLWHRLLLISSGGKETSLPEHSWIAARYAASPDPTAFKAAAEHKLFAGSLLASVHAPVEVAVQNLSADLAGCMVTTEPGALADGNKLYVSLYCINIGAGANPLAAGRQVLLVRDGSGPWTYAGTLTTNADATKLNASYTEFSATELVRSGGKPYLLVTPTKPFAGTGFYQGCTAFEIVDLANAKVARQSGSGDAIVAKQFTMSIGAAFLAGVGFGGACGYHEASKTGLVYSERFASQPVFRMFQTFQRL